MITTLTPEERMIWQAAYGSAFVAETDRHMELGGQPRAEPAIKVANGAVLALREWRTYRNSAAGIMLEEE